MRRSAHAPLVVANEAGNAWTMKRLLGVSAIVLSTVLALACGGGVDATPLADPDVSGATQSADGVPYPTDNIGTRGRTRSRPGDRIANFAFQGYVDGDPKGTLKTVSLADYFDPEQKRHKILHIQGVAGWCGICAGEARQTAPVVAQLREEGAIVIQILFQGQTQTNGPALVDLEKWCNTYETQHPVLFDANARRLSVFGIDGFPWNALVDTRTMEILDQGTGAPNDVAKYVREGLRLAALPAATW